MPFPIYHTSIAMTGSRSTRDDLDKASRTQWLVAAVKNVIDVPGAMLRAVIHTSISTTGHWYNGPVNIEIYR